MASSLKKLGARSYKICILGISLFFITFEVFRTARAAFTADEAATYLVYIASNFLAIFNFGSANNHFLNTLLAKFSWALAGNSEFVLRIPNLLGYGIYLLFSFLILDRFIKKKTIIVCGYLLLTLNPYVLDFFSLCRGYGLSLGFMMAALFFFLTFLDRSIRRQPDHSRPLELSLAAACLAVLSNFNLLNVYLSLVVVACVLFVALNAKAGRSPSPASARQNHPQRKKILILVIGLAAVVFNLLVMSHDLARHRKLFAPVVVRITGLSQEGSRNFAVFGINIDNQERLWSYENDHWTLGEPTHVTAVKFRCLPGLLNRIRRIEISIGNETFGVDAADIQKVDHFQNRCDVFYSQYSTSLKRSGIPIFRSVINWRGDGIFFRALLMRVLLFAGIAALLIALIFGMGLLLCRRKILFKEQFRSLVRPTLVLAIFIGYPLYVLKTGGALSWGERTGFIRSTVFSLIYKSFYEQRYVRGQEWAIFLPVLFLIFLFLTLIFVHYRRRTLADVLSGLSVLAILLLASASTVLQHVLFGNPYLFQRTALFFIPLFTLFLIFLFHSLSLMKAPLEIISVSFLLIVTLFSSGHFYQTANTALAIDWINDADTKSMLDDLKKYRDQDFSGRSKIRLGIPASRNLALQYYVHRMRPAWLEVHVAPPYREYDFYYLDEPFEEARMVLIKSYPVSGTILVKPRQ
jgi:hypothetical protein